MEDKIIQILEEVTNEKISEDYKKIDLLEDGIIDSLGFVEFTGALEDEFGIEIQLTQVPLDTWRSIEKIVELVKEELKK